MGPTLVALLIQHTSLGYTSMAWVGFAFYALHAPAILTAMGAGTRLVALNSSPEDEVNGNGGLGGAGGGEQPVGDLEAEGAHSLATPLLAHRFVRNSHEGHSSLPITVNPSYAEDIRQPRVSLPGHYSSLSRSSTSHRHQGGGGGGGGGGGLAGLTGSSPPSALHHPAPHNSRGVHFGVGSLGSNQGGGVGRGRGGGGSSHETTPPQSNTPTSGSHVAASVFSGVGSLGYLAPGTHDGDGLLGGAAAATGHEDEEAAGFARVSKM